MTDQVVLADSEVTVLAALLACVLPSSSGAGATEAGAIDYVLKRLGLEPPDLVAALRDELTGIAGTGGAGGFDPEDTLERWRLGTPPEQALFRRVRAWAWEGFLCDPVHGGNRGMVGWRRFGIAGPPQPAGFTPAELLGADGTPGETGE